MAISLNDINKKASRGVKSILDVILERKEEKLSGKLRKKRVLRPWQSSNGEVSPKNSVMSPFEKERPLSDDELISIKVSHRASELFKNISDFL